MRFVRLKQETLEYYDAKLKEHGACPRGVDWKDAQSQRIRFGKLLEVLEDGPPAFSLNDLGCGYGALLDELLALGAAVDYHGYDLSPAMVETARSRFPGGLPGGATAAFHTGDDLRPADYTVASGIFNVRQDTPDHEWRDYVGGVLDQMDRSSRLGFSFNMLTKYSDAEYMRGHLYYADPEDILATCIRKYSRWVAVLHDYHLYEFTVIVRKDDH